MPSELRVRMRSLFRSRAVEAELDDGLRFPIEQNTAEPIAQGIEPDEARRRAMAKFAGIQNVMEEWRGALGVRLVEPLIQDVRFGWRMLRKSRGFTAIAIVTLALGVGANTAIFSAVNGILIEPLPYRDSARLVEIEDDTLLGGSTYSGGLTLRAARDVQAHCPAIGQMAFFDLVGTNLLGGAFPDDVMVASVSGDFFTMLGVRPLLGRSILPSDLASGGDYVAVLSYRLWRDDFGSNPRILGKEIMLGKKPYTLVGVMPPGFGRGMFGGNPIVWAPLHASDLETGRASHDYYAMGRLRPGVTLAEANVQLRTLSARLAAAYPATEKGWKLEARSEKDEEIGSTLPQELLILLGAVGLILLIACVNLSAMLLARNWARNREVAIRAAVGATRARIVRQFLVESLLLSLAAGALGLLLAAWLVPALRAIAPPGTPRIDRLALDSNVLWFTLGVSVMSGILFGLLPAVQASGRGLGATLKEGLGGLLEGFSTRGPRRLRGALVAIEIALAVILATGAALVGRSLQKMMAVPLGFRADHLLIARATLAGPVCNSGRQPAACYLADEEILRRLRALPGVEGATAGNTVPLVYGGPESLGIAVEARGLARVERSSRGIKFGWATPGYFRLLGIRLLAGRDFNESDTTQSRRVAIVNEAFEKRFLSGVSPLGQRIGLFEDKQGRREWMEIIGEVGSVHGDSIVLPPTAEIYMPGTQAGAPTGAPTFVVRTQTEPQALAAAAREQIASVDAEAPIDQMGTLTQIIALREAGPRFRAALFGAFGLLGIVLAMVGIYGVVSFAVGRRTREIGLRMALGARPSDALGMVMREGAALAGVGIIIGLGGALALTRLLRSFLFEIQPGDAGTFAAASLAIAAAALVACYVPARRAMRVDPVVALRQE